MRKSWIGTACLVAATLGLGAAHGQGTPPAEARPKIDLSILHAQVILDHLGFSPGILDGREGQSLKAALNAFQQTRGLPRTGKLDQATLRALHPYRALRPLKRLSLTESSLQGPFVNPMPKEPEAQARLQTMAYSGPLEKLAEMFHTTPEVLTTLNGGSMRLEPGAILLFPNALPTSRDYAADLEPAWRQTLNDLNVDARQPHGERVVVDESEGVLKVYGAGNRLVAQFSATMGSEHDPLPIGSWKIQGIARNPDFHYNPELFWDVSDKKPKVRLPPGPNGPVGVVWLDLNKPHYGIHGTPEPQTIGRTESHGCIRLTNWDAARLAMIVKPGTVAVFQR